MISNVKPDPILAGWYQALVRHLSADDVQSIAAILERETGADQHGATRSEAMPTAPLGRLLAHYISRAAEATCRDRSRGDLALIDEALRLRATGQLSALAAIGLRGGERQARPSPVPGPMPGIESPEMADAIRLVYRQTLGREAADAEVEIWRGHFRNGLAFHEFLLAVANGDEARRHKQSLAIAADKSDGEFIIDLYRVVYGRGCTMIEVEQVESLLRRKGMSRSDLLRSAFELSTKLESAGSDTVLHDGLSCWIMGTPHTLTLDEWTRKAQDKAALDAARKALRPATPFVITGEPGVRVSAIASLYRGGDFIEQFLDNITGQTCFDRYCELIIIDAASPENEGEVISRYLADHPNIRYERTTTTIGIYEAWNLGVKLARGRYLTNTNLDDLRRADSLEIQAGALDAMLFADIVYQDFYYSFDPRLSWEEVAAFGYKSNVPIVAPGNLLKYNSPHNAPMWRRALHDELGYFDSHYRSAGDLEFWLRCLAAGKVFYKINEPHVVYYQNPRGLSTRADTRGIVEGKAATRKYTPLLIDKDFTRHFAEFAAQVPGAPASHAECPDLTRYEIVQKGLRNAAIQYKTGGR